MARVDVKDSVLLKAELKAIEQETSKAVERGPTYHEKKNQMSSSRIAESCTTPTGSRKPCYWPGGLSPVRSLPTRDQNKERRKAAEKL